jgi:hypothetical protein
VSLQTYGPGAVVAGASVGLGAAFAEDRPQRGSNAITIALRGLWGSLTSARAADVLWGCQRMMFSTVYAAARAVLTLVVLCGRRVDALRKVGR